jgi:hypothetical protein
LGVDRVVAFVTGGDHDDAARAALAVDLDLQGGGAVMGSEVAAEADGDDCRPVAGKLERLADTGDRVVVVQRLAAHRHQRRLRSDPAEASAGQATPIPRGNGRTMRAVPDRVAVRDFFGLVRRPGLSPQRGVDVGLAVDVVG